MTSRSFLFTTSCLALTLLAGPSSGPPVLAATACDTLGAADWVRGDWVAEQVKSTVYESWASLSAQTFEGEGWTVTNASGERTGFESLRLVEMSGQVFYLAKVAHNPVPIAFGLTICEPDRLVFENPEHDFPKRIEYLRHDDDRLSVLVSDGGEQGFRLDFERVANDNPGLP